MVRDMYRRPYKVVVRDPSEDMRVVNSRSTFKNKQAAIDRAWEWVEKGYVASVHHFATGAFFYADQDTYPVGWVVPPF